VRLDGIAFVMLGGVALVAAVVMAFRIWRDPVSGLCLWILLLPVARSAASFAGYPPDEGPEVLRKLTIGDPVLVFTIVAALLAPADPGGGVGGRQGRRIVALFTAFCVLAIVSAFLADAGPEALVEIVTYFWLCATLVIVCRLLSSRERLERVLGALRWSAVLACATGLGGTLLLLRGSVENFLVRDGRVTGLFEAPNQVMSFMFAAIPFLCATAAASRTPRFARLWYIGLAVASMLIVLASGSRGGVVLIVVSLWLMFVATAPRAAAVSTCVLVLAAGSAWQAFEQHQEQLPFAIRRAVSFTETDSYDLHDLSHGRANQVEAWGTVFVEHPVFGVGLDQFRLYVARLVVGAKAQEMHNSYLAVLAETGLVGALIMFSLLATVLSRSVAFARAAWRARGPDAFGIAAAMVVSYGALLLYGMFQYGLRQRYFWLVVALIICVPRLYSRPVPVRAR
jgi:O-antigen ligase